MIGKDRMGLCRDCADGTDAIVQLKVDQVYVPFCQSHYFAELDRMIRTLFRAEMETYEL